MKKIKRILMYPSGESGWMEKHDKTHGFHKDNIDPHIKKFKKSEKEVDKGIDRMYRKSKR